MNVMQNRTNARREDYQGAKKNHCACCGNPCRMLFCDKECQRLYSMQNYIHKDLIDQNYDQSRWLITKDPDGLWFERDSRFPNVDFLYMGINMTLTEGTEVMNLKSRKQYVVDYRGRRTPFNPQTVKPAMFLREIVAG